MAVVEKYKKYALEKKQVSRDRGVTWEDVTPSETRYGEELGIFDTLEECEDTNCDLEKYEYYVADGVLPDEICANVIKTIPFGILSNITFTDGAYCCNDWADAGAYVTNLFGERVSQPTGRRICGGGYCPGWGYYNDVNVYGFQMELGSGKVCYVDLNTCIRINSFMPWAEGKETWKILYKQHYTREHCSEEWEADGEPESYSIGERWIRESEDFYNEYWRHQYASVLDDSGNVVTWRDAELETRQMSEYTLPSEIEFIDYIKNDGVASTSLTHTSVPPMFHTDISLDGNLTPSGVTYSSMWRYVNDYVYSDYRAVYHQGDYVDPGYYIDSYVASPTTWQDIVQKLTNTFERITYSGREEHRMLFGALWVSDSWGLEESGPTSMAYGLRHKKIYRRGHTNLSAGTMADADRTDCTTVAFPYHIVEDNGYQGDDAYYNISEVGYILRDGTKLVLETIMGSYINTNGVRKPLASNTPSSLVPPSDAANITLNNRCTSIPSDAFKGNSILTAITMSDNTYVGNNAFSGTTNLQSVTFGNNTTLGERVFEGSHIRSIDLSGVISMGWNTFRMSSLESLTIGNTLTSIPDYAFYGCSSLRGALVIPSTIEGVGGSAFQGGCTGITSVTLNEGLRAIGQFSFYGMSITEITIPSTVGYYGYSGAFKYCSKLEKVTINTTATIPQDTFVGCNIKCLTITTTTPPLVRNGRAIWGGVFDFASDAVILVPASAVDTYKNDGGNEGWHNVASMIHPIPTETEWVNIGYACVDGQRYDYEHKRGRNTAYSNDWFWLPEYRTVGEPYGECDGTEPY